MPKLASALWCLGLEPPSASWPRGQYVVPAQTSVTSHQAMPGEAVTNASSCSLISRRPVPVLQTHDSEPCLRQNSGLDLCPVASCAPPSPALPASLTVTPPALAYLSFHPSLGAGVGGCHALGPAQPVLRRPLLRTCCPRSTRGSECIKR